MGNENYMGYQAMLTSVSTSIAKLDSICKYLGMDGQSDGLKSIEGKLKNHIFSVGIMGEFRRGKSTVINALLGQEVVPADIVPCSATLNYVKWDVNKAAEIYFKDGTVQRVPVEDLSKYVTKITKESEKISGTVEKAIVYYPCQFCQNGVQIIDTPGLNDDERMTMISEKVIPTLDAIIMVIVPDSPFSQGEAEFVRNKVMASDLGRIIFVVNKIDTIDEDDRDRLLDTIRERIQNSVLEKMVKIYGEDSAEYKNTVDKLGQIKLLPISARKALKGKLKNNQAFLDDSGYVAFEETLAHLLTEERGSLELMHPVNQLFSVSAEALKIIETRLSTLNLEQEEFEKRQNKALAQIKETREQKKTEIEILKNKGFTLYATLLPEATQIYDQLEAELCDFVDCYEILESDVSNESSMQAFSNEFSNRTDAKMKEILSENTERLIYQIREQLGRDIQGLERFGNEFNSAMDNIHVNMSVNGNEQNSTLKNTCIDFGALIGSQALFGTVLPGVGGLVAGYRDHGVKGAVVGGVTGLVASNLVASMAITAGIAALPALLIVSAVSSFGGKAMANLLFGKKQSAPSGVEGVRNALMRSVMNALRDFKGSSTIENWLKETCETSYDSVAVDLDKEWENSLESMENTLMQIKVDLEMGAATKEKTEIDMNNYATEISEIMEIMKPIKDKLLTSLQN